MAAESNFAFSIALHKKTSFFNSWQISNDYISRMELENIQDIQGKISKIKEKKE